MAKHQLHLKGNQPILLNDPTRVWLVESGSIALFAVHVKNGSVPVGSRRYLFSCEPPEALFSIVPDTGEPQIGILAVAVAQTELLEMDAAQWEELVAEESARIRAQVEGWIGKISGVGAGLDMEVPQADTSTLPSLDNLRVTFSQLYTYLCHAIAWLEQQEQEEAILTLQARERFNNQATAEAFGELASLLPQPGDRNRNPVSAIPGEISNDEDYSALYMAASAVGEALGIKINPPQQSENLKKVREPLEALARASRIRTRRVVLTDYWWQCDTGPILAYTRDSNRPVALLPVSAASYEIFDPVEQTRTPVDAQSVRTLAPTAYMFYPPLPDKKLQALDLLQFAFSGRVRDLLVIIWTGIAITLLGMFTPIATAILFDYAIPDADWGLLIQVGLGLLAAAAGGLTFQLTRGFALMRVETLADAYTQAAVWDRLLNLPVPFFRQYSTGDLRSRVSAISAIHHQLGGTTLQTLFTSLVALGNLALLFYYSWQLALVASAIALITIVTTTAFGILTLRQVRRLQELEGNIFGLMVQMLNGVAKLRVAAAEERAFAYWGKQYSQQQQLKLKVQQYADSLTIFNQVLSPLSSALLFAVATISIQAGDNNLSTGTFLAFYAAFGILIAGAVGLGDVASNVLSALVLWERVKPILETTPEVDAQKTDPGQLSGKIALDRVTFSYRPGTSPVLDNASIHIEPGEFIALVGPSGSGKSTVLRLLLGFEIPQSGKVCYDGQDLRELNIEAVRRQLGVVLQTNRLNTASIFENISAGALISMDEAWEASRQAGLADDIAAMPMQMHTVISEGGGNISGGQRQRLFIARALALKPRILLLDEATSALDNRTQAVVTESLNNLQITRIVIAHRLSTIRNADRIYVLESGRVVQQGRFEELIALEGLFARLMQRQLA